VRRVTFLRHGNTAPSPTGADVDRKLTELGRDQSRQAGRAFGATLWPYRNVLVSPSPRTVETARLFLEEASAAMAATGASELAGSLSAVDLSLVSGLYDGTMQPEGSALFRRLGYAPVRTYVEADDPADRNAARRVLGEYSTFVACEIHRHMNEPMLPSAAGDIPDSPDGTTVLVVGHAIYLPAAALGVAVLCGCSKDGQDALLDTNTKEAQGYCVDLFDAKVTLLNR
jgi:broad specificity phosphatase PhoE